MKIVYLFPDEECALQDKMQQNYQFIMDALLVKLAMI